MEKKKNMIRVWSGEDIQERRGQEFKGRIDGLGDKGTERWTQT